MSKPDHDPIAEVTLYSEGFKDANNFGHKLVSIFTLSKRLLTPQQYYDWGLRALKTVLRGCGNMLRMAKREGSGGEGGEAAVMDKAREAVIIVQALRLNTLSKLTFTDCIRFDALIKDVFADVEFNNAGYGQLKEAIRESCTELGYDVNENQVKKAIELYEQLQQRMGVVIVGPSGSGKTTLFTILKHALVKMGQTVKQHTMNPRPSRVPSCSAPSTWTRASGPTTCSPVDALQAVDEPVDVTTWIVCGRHRPRVDRVPQLGAGRQQAVDADLRLANPARPQHLLHL